MDGLGCPGVFRPTTVHAAAHTLLSEPKVAFPVRPVLYTPPV